MLSSHKVIYGEQRWLITENQGLVFPCKKGFRDLWNPVGSREINYIKMNFTKRQKAILTGTLLGDGFLQKTGAKNARLRLEHGERQKEYILWKGKQFPRLFQGLPVRLRRVHPLTKRAYTYWRWQSVSTPELGKWRNLFYVDGKKQIPKALAGLITESIALAVWYMDDGYYDLKQKHSFIYLGRVSRAEAEIACNAIVKNFHITPHVYDKKNKGFALFFSVAETRLLHAVMRLHIIPSMNYKLSLTP